ncbi:MAG TPA: type IV toxin-antitoxin system AbiEi family antitoxin [Pyrinomonadaceae bacterium]|nr:type IV toxin-antitoxin system AbiEi family antitoxin [Pyrinomonadaceae bacterium]
MSIVQEKDALRKVVTLIKEWTSIESGEVDYNPMEKGFGIDLIQSTGNWVFSVEYKSSGATQMVIGAIENLHKNIGKIGENVIPVVAVPFMGETGRRLCKEKKVSWLDLSGNADITASGLRIYVEGKPNKFKSVGRPKDIFAPKSSRITRHLLIDPERYITQRELTNEINLDEGLVSRVVREMEKSGLLQRESSAGGVRPKDPNILLDEWREKYNFSKHRIIKGFVAERSSNLAVKNLVEGFKSNNVNYALTGLSAAWLLSSFAAYRTASIYLSEEPSEELLQKANFTKGEKGSNVWLVVPNDKGVFDGAFFQKDVRCVHPVQIYLDLKGHPERANEAAERLREEFLNWEKNAI